MKCKRIFYVGLDPTRFRGKGVVTHCPLIKIVARPFEEVSGAFATHPLWTDIILTSREATSLFFAYAQEIELWKKRFVVIGEGTKERLLSFGPYAYRMAEKACAEAVASLLGEGYFFYPHSSGARAVIAEALRPLPHTSCVLYETRMHRPAILPKIEKYDQIVFTSPSTVQAFVTIFGALPQDKELTAIGPITQKSVDKFLRAAHNGGKKDGHDGQEIYSP